jgi:rubrerythrin
MTHDNDRPQQRSALEELDRDPSSRSRFLKAIGTTGAVAAFGTFLAACGSDSKSSSSSSTSASGTATTSMASGDTSGTEMFGKGDLGIVGYALTLEYLETDFYKQAIASGKLKGDALALAKQFGEEEAEHVAALEGALKKAGGKLPAKPKGKFPLDSQDAILKLAGTVENLGAAAYLGQAGLIQDPEILAAALSIHSIEARHAAALNTALGKDITPDGAFAVPADAKTVLAKVQPLIAQ